MQCYNIGCSKKFEEQENTDKSCVFHLSRPIFHDGKKGWDCCKKFSTDFSTCLNTPGCQTGYHNPTKPAEPPKPTIDPKYDVPVVVINPIEKQPERPSGDEEMIPLPVTVSTGLEADLNKRRQEIEAETKSTDADGDESIAVGTPCKNLGCKKLFSHSDDNKEICTFHSGYPIFHEGLKFYTCCQRKTTDWEGFMAQEGCASGRHLWRKKQTLASCRFDWFQTGPTVTISMYAKLVLPGTVVVRVNSVRLSLAFEFDCGASKYERQFELLQEIDPEQCTVRLNSAKLEIVLRKKKMNSWDRLECPASS